MSTQSPFEGGLNTEELQFLEETADTAPVVGPLALSGEVLVQPVTVNLDLGQLTAAQVDSLLDERVHAEAIRPRLVLPADVSIPQAYNRLRDQERKDQYRSKLNSRLHDAWRAEYGTERAATITSKFDQLSAVIQQDGALVLGDLINRENFAMLVKCYDGLMQQDGSVSLLHSYANLRNQPDFLANPEFNSAFFHPLAIALISERVGGGIRVVDARAKDAGPISVRAQDNMLHIDNTPYRDEYKILVTWEKGKASGPKGQNFVFLPGTHQGVRDSLVNPKTGEVYSTENASIFIHKADVDQVFDLQEQVRQGGNAVVEIHDKERPLTTVFPSGSLVHHRLRTEEGSPRSSLIIAFHRTADTPGEFIANYFPAGSQQLEAALFRYQDESSDDHFVQILALQATAIAEKIEEIFAYNGAAIAIDAKVKTLTAEDMKVWRTIATDAPTVEEIKQRAKYFPLGANVDRQAFIELLGTQMMIHDKHGPIDMILYSDGHEEPRKWARNRIREMRANVLQQRLESWQDHITQPTPSDLLTIEQMTELTERLITISAAVPVTERAKAHLDAIERISPLEAYRSVEQLIIDLGENLTRTEDRQTYLSASLFQFWACDELNHLQGGDNPELISIGGHLLRHYIATAILIEKQITGLVEV